LQGRDEFVTLRQGPMPEMIRHDHGYLIWRAVWSPKISAAARDLLAEPIVFFFELDDRLLQLLGGRWLPLTVGRNLGAGLPLPPNSVRMIEIEAVRLWSRRAPPLYFGEVVHDLEESAPAAFVVVAEAVTL